MEIDNLKTKVTELAQASVAKAKDLAEIAKLKIDSAAEGDTIRKAYAEIGKLYFAQHGLDPDPAYAALCARIIESKERIAYNEERVADIRRVGQLTDEDLAQPAEVPQEDPEEAEPQPEPAAPETPAEPEE